MMVREDDCPDVVLEMDHSRDRHQGKLKRYKS